MAARRRLPLRSIDSDPRARAIQQGALHLGLGKVRETAIADLVFIDGELSDTELQRLHAVLVDPLLQRGSWEIPTGSGIEIMRQPGVTDTELFQTWPEHPAKWQNLSEMLKPEEMAELIAFIASRPWHFNINEILVRPTEQIV